MRHAKGTRYSVILPRPLEKDLEDLTEELDTTKAEILRRSLTLFKHAIKAEKVELLTKTGEKQEVLLR